MADLTRFGVSIETGLLTEFDTLITRQGYNNRSEALRDLIRQRLVEERITADEPVAGSLTIMYNHHHGDLSERLTSFQHDYEQIIIATMHVHISHHDCMEVIALRGPASRLQHFAEHLLTMKGIHHGKLVITATQ